jgi:lipid A 1-phosphatase
MKSRSLFAAAYLDVQRPVAMIVFLVLSITLSAIYPSHLDTYPVLGRSEHVPEGVLLTEDYARFVPTAVQVALPVVLGDKVGLVQLLYVAAAGVITTHGLKFLLNDRWIGRTRLGERPNHRDHNMPSGHSSMVSCAVYFVWRRYSPWLGLLLSAFMLVTMYARVMLNAHTVSAVIAGALAGLLAAALFTSPCNLR